MSGSVFDCVFLVILITSLFQGNDGTGIEHDELPTDIELVLKLMQAIYENQTHFHNDFVSLNTTYFSISGHVGDLHGKTSQLAWNITDLAARHENLNNKLKTVNQAVANVSANLNATQSEVSKTKSQVASLITKTNHVEATCSQLNTTMININVENKLKMEEIKVHLTTEVDVVKNKTTSFATSLTQLKQNVAHVSWKSQESLSKTNATDAEIEKLKEQLRVFKSTTEKLRSEVKVMKNAITKLQGKPRYDGIMFMAMFSIDMYNLQQNVSLPFDLVNLNVGNGYNKATGKFKAPMAGIYMFIVQLQSRKSGYVFARIVKSLKGSSKTTDVAELYTAVDTGIRDESGTMHVMLSLEVGDQVWVTMNGGAKNYYGLFRSHFTGFRLPDQ